MAGLGGRGLVAQVDDGGNGHGVPVEDVGQFLIDVADAACPVGGVVVTGVVVIGVVVGVAGDVHGFGHGFQRGGRLGGTGGAL